MSIPTVQTAKGFTEIEGEAILLDSANKILARKTKSDTVFIQMRSNAGISILEMIDDVVIWCAKNNKDFRRVNSIPVVFSKASVEKIMAGDAKLAKELGLDLSEEVMSVISKIPEVKQLLTEAITGSSSISIANDLVEQLAINSGLSPAEQEKLREWRKGAGTRCQRDILNMANKMYGNNRRLLRYKPGQGGKSGQVHSSDDYGMPERYAKNIALKAESVWAGAADKPTSTSSLYSGYEHSRSYTVHSEYICIDCQTFPRQEVEWLIEYMEWNN